MLGVGAAGEPDELVAPGVLFALFNGALDEPPAFVLELAQGVEVAGGSSFARPWETTVELSVAVGVAVPLTPGLAVLLGVPFGLKMLLGLLLMLVLGLVLGGWLNVADGALLVLSCGVLLIRAPPDDGHADGVGVGLWLVETAGGEVPAEDGSCEAGEP
jgi:hypothetical protein